LLESAAVGKEVRSSVFEGLKARAANLLQASNKKVLDEMIRVVFIDEKRAPKDWSWEVCALLAELHKQSSDSFDAKQEWIRLAYKVRGQYESNS